jgi:hypothetical protein
MSFYSDRMMRASVKRPVKKPDDETVADAPAVPVSEDENKETPKWPER